MTPPYNSGRGNAADDNERELCIEDGCSEPRERVVTKFGGVAPLCDEHADERLANDPKAVDQTAYFTGEREEPKPEPKPSGARRRSR